jgi:hypothetical protein
MVVDSTGPERLDPTMMEHDFPLSSDFAAIDRAARAMVNLAVAWSVPELRSRRVVRAALAELSGALGVEFFAIDEDDPAARIWMQHHRNIPIGSGTLLWLECGTVVAKGVTPSHRDPSAIVQRTLDLWQRQT